MFQYSWKLLHPTDTHQNPECPQDAEEYERVSRIANLLSMVMSCLSIKLYKESAKPFNIAFYMFYGVNESGFLFHSQHDTTTAVMKSLPLSKL